MGSVLSTVVRRSTAAPADLGKRGLEGLTNAVYFTNWFVKHAQKHGQTI